MPNLVCECLANIKCSEILIISIISEQNYLRLGKWKLFRKYFNALKDQIYFSSKHFLNTYYVQSFLRNVFPKIFQKAQFLYPVRNQVISLAKFCFFRKRVKENSINIDQPLIFLLFQLYLPRCHLLIIF